MFDKIANPPLELRNDEKSQGQLETRRQKSSEIIISIGDFKEAAKSIDNFKDFLYRLGHEMIHAFQNLKLSGIPQLERELMAYIFMFYPDEVMELLRRNYNAELPDISYREYMKFENAKELRFYMSRLISYYNRSPQNIKARYAYFVNRILYFYRILFFNIIPSRPFFVQPSPVVLKQFFE